MDYLVDVKQRYHVCTFRQGKSSIIDEVIANTGMNRKSVIRTLNRKIQSRRRTRFFSPGRKVKYPERLHVPLEVIWNAAGRPCAKRLVPQIGEMIDKLKQFNELSIERSDELLLTTASHFTINALLENVRVAQGETYGLGGTKTSPLLKTLVLTRIEFTEEEKSTPGHLELDCVLHCGDSLSGEYAETLNSLDIATHWNEKTIFMHKCARRIVSLTDMLIRQYPYPILSVDFDNGYEFLNWKMHEYCTRNNINFTRGRSYHKNDQAHIEGKNNHSIRKVIGYARIDDQKTVDLIEDLYQHEIRLLTNFFYTTMKLKRKEKDLKSGKSTKSYEVAKTPYQRVLESDTVSPEMKDKLRLEYMKLNPVQLHRELTKKLKVISDVMSEQKQVTEK